VFTSEIGVQPAGDTAELQMQISGRAPELSLEQREKRKFAKRIIKFIQPALEEAIKKESELNRKPFEQELKELDLMLENSVMSRRGSEVESTMLGGEGLEQPGVPNGTDQKANGDVVVAAKLGPLDGAKVTALPQKTEDVAMPDADQAQPSESAAVPQAQTSSSVEHDPGKQETMAIPPPTQVQPKINGVTEKSDENNSVPTEQLVESQQEPLTPPPSFKGDQQLPLAQGGIQWYMQPFDPVGTTIHEERWTGRDVMRGMSEELSELDEEELKDLVDDELEGEMNTGVDGSTASGADSTPEQAIKVHRTRRRWRGFK
jgi:NuA3 HAT complex component NTO1